MKREYRVFSILPLLLFGVGGLIAQPHLKFDEGGQFKIVQVTDMHINQIGRAHV